MSTRWILIDGVDIETLKEYSKIFALEGVYSKRLNAAQHNQELIQDKDWYIDLIFSAAYFKSKKEEIRQSLLKQLPKNTKIFKINIPNGTIDCLIEG